MQTLALGKGVILGSLRNIVTDFALKLTSVQLAAARLSVRWHLM